MAVDNSQSQESDLDRTDRLPILDGSTFDLDVEDDAVPMEYTVAMPTIRNDFPRPTGLDLPSLAESVRSVEERIARQSADYDALNRSHEKLRETEAAATSRAGALAAELAALRASSHEEITALRGSSSADLMGLRSSFDTELAALRSLLEAEQNRSRETEKALRERSAAHDAARTQTQEAMREVERHQSEAVTLRNTLAARDTAVAQALHSLGERDAQLVSLQREHAQMVPALQTRVEQGEHLGEELRGARERLEALTLELKSAQGSVASLNAKLRAGDIELGSTRSELIAARTTASTYLEQLRTREWRRGFDHNLFRQLDAKIGTVQDDHGAVQSQRDELRGEVAELKIQISTRDETIAALRGATLGDKQLLEKQEQDLRRLERERTELREKLTTVETERDRLNQVLTTQQDSLAKFETAAVAAEARRVQHEQDLQNLDGARATLVTQIQTLGAERDLLQADLADKSTAMQQVVTATADEKRRVQSAHAAELESLESLHAAAIEKVTTLLTGETERVVASLAAAEAAHSTMAAEVERLKVEAQARDEEHAALRVHLQEARRPLQAIEAEIKRLSGELAAKTTTLETLAEENRNLRSSVERTKGALEEREFLIRRLERSESNNANVLGRIQTSIERLGTPTAVLGNASQPVECTAELARIDGEHNTSHTLGRRTRIGRAPGCELRVDSSSVSRHHALVLVGTREAIIEDLNSTNGVLVNGRKVSRQMLNDGDMVTIGEAQFRFNLTLAPRVLEAPAAAE